MTFSRRFLSQTSFAVFFLFALNGPLFADSSRMEPASQDALARTVELLIQPSQRNEAIQKDPNAQFIDKQVKSLAGSEANAQEIYELAADIFQTLIQKSGGDSMAAIAELQKAKSDPKGFAAKLTPDQQARLRKLARKLEASGPAAPQVSPPSRK